MKKALMFLMTFTLGAFLLSSAQAKGKKRLTQKQKETLQKLKKEVIQLKNLKKNLDKKATRLKIKARQIRALMALARKRHRQQMRTLRARLQQTNKKVKTTQATSKRIGGKLLSAKEYIDKASD